jgi:hypothetical protein
MSEIAERIAKAKAEAEEMHQQIRANREAKADTTRN